MTGPVRHRVHQTAHCRDCEWDGGEGDWRTTTRRAAYHHRKTGHHVVAEGGQVIEWRRAP